MLMVTIFVSPPSRYNVATTKVLRLPNAVAFVPISTSNTVPTIIIVFLFAPYHFNNLDSEVTYMSLVSILVLMVQRGSGGAIASVFFDFFESCISVPLIHLHGQNKDSN